MNANGLKTQLQFPFRDASDVEQVINEPRFQFDISPDNLERFCDGLGIGQLGFEFPHHRDYWRKRATKLVR